MRHGQTGANGFKQDDSLLTPHEVYLDLGQSGAGRLAAWRKAVLAAGAPDNFSMVLVQRRGYPPLQKGVGGHGTRLRVYTAIKQHV